MGGGEVDVTWSSNHAHGCALLLDGESIALGTDGEETLEVDATSEIGLVCVDEEHEDFTETARMVVVQTPPVDFYDEAAPAVDSPEWEETSHVAKFYVDTVVQRHLVINQESRVIMEPASGPERTAITLWIAQDSNEDGFVDSDEILAIARSNAQERIDIELDEGQYSVFIESEKKYTQ